MALNFCNNNSLSAITSIPAAISGGSLNLISTQTASSSSTISFTSGLDSTYKEYIFKFINIHPATDGASLTFNGSSDTGINYNVTKTTTAFRAYHQQDGGGQALGYRTSDDLAQSTSFQILNFEVDNDADSACSGEMFLFNPSSTTFVKHFTSEANNSRSINYTYHSFIAGYGNTTSAVDAVQFKMTSSNIDAGDICLYGIL